MSELPPECHSPELVARVDVILDRAEAAVHDLLNRYLQFVQFVDTQLEPREDVQEPSQSGIRP